MASDTDFAPGRLAIFIASGPNAGMIVELLSLAGETPFQVMLDRPRIVAHPKGRHWWCRSTGARAIAYKIGKADSDGVVKGTEWQQYDVREGPLAECQLRIIPGIDLYQKTPPIEAKE